MNIQNIIDCTARQEITTLLSTYFCSSSLVSPPDMATLATSAALYGAC